MSYPTPKTWRVYALHAGDLRFKYVGVTSHPIEDRLSDHVRRSKHGKKQMPVYDWIRAVGAERIRIVELEHVGSQPHLEREEFWITWFFEHGHDLVNEVHIPGRHSRPATEEARLKISLKKKGVPCPSNWSVEGRARTSAGIAARNQTDEGRANARRAMHVRWHVNRDLTKPDCEFCYPISGSSSTASGS